MLKFIKKVKRGEHWKLMVKPKKIDQEALTRGVNKYV